MHRQRITISTFIATIVLLIATASFPMPTQSQKTIVLPPVYGIEQPLTVLPVVNALHAPSQPTTQSAIAISAGQVHTCALLHGGGVKCWGSNYSGQLGNNSTIDSHIPVDVYGLTSGVAAISLGGAHTCALLIIGVVKCWGSNFYGQLGNNSTVDSHIPVDVTGLSSEVTVISLGVNQSCALLTTGGVKCWGRNYYGELGNNSTVDSRIPVDVSGLGSGVTAIDAGGHQNGAHNCALLNTGRMKCWGNNFFGQLGNNSTTDSLIPLDVYGLTSGVTAISVGGFHTCALLVTDGPKCWGYNVDGQLGTNWFNHFIITPVDIYGLTSSVTALSTGDVHTCALLSIGGVKCWGDNLFGQLGNNSTTETSVPAEVSGLGGGIVAISAGGYHTCALLSGGGIKCWGYNYYGQLGNNSTIDSHIPVDVVGLTNQTSTTLSHSR